MRIRTRTPINRNTVTWHTWTATRTRTPITRTTVTSLTVIVMPTRTLIIPTTVPSHTQTVRTRTRPTPIATETWGPSIRTTRTLTLMQHMVIMLTRTPMRIRTRTP